MGLEGLAPGPNTSRPREEDEKFPYLLRGLVIDEPNQVWATDILKVAVLVRWFLKITFREPVWHQKSIEPVQAASR
jgi:hypothetical protein